MPSMSVMGMFQQLSANSPYSGVYYQQNVDPVESTSKIRV
jgi:hypothetical protein